MNRAAVIQTAFLGDAVLTTPLIELLAAEHGPVDVVTTPEATPLFETLPTVDRVVTFDKRGAHRGLRGIRLVARSLTTRGLGYAYLPHQSLRSALIARLAGIEHRIGFRTSAARWLYTDRRAGSGDHEIERLCSLTRGERFPQPCVSVTPHDAREADEALARAGIGRDFVVIAPGSRQPTKRWPYYPALADRLTKTVDVVVLGDENDYRTCRHIVADRHRAANLAGTLSIRASAVVIHRAHIVICNDSVALHLAGAMGTPVLAIFGPTDPSLGFGPRGTQDLTLGVRHLPCRPCSLHGGRRCPLHHHKCMVDLAVDTVADAAITLLETTEARSPCV